MKGAFVNKLKTHSPTIAALAFLWAFIVWMPNVAEDQAVWHAVVLLAIGIGVVVVAGGHRVLLERSRTTTATLGLAAFFFALPIAGLWISDIVSYLLTGPSTSFGVDGEYTRPLYLDLLRHLGWGIEILFYVVPMTMGTLIAVGRPASVEELWEYFWIGIPVVATVVGFTMAMEELYAILNPQVTPFAFGFGHFTVDVIEAAIIASLVFAVAWTAGVVAYKKLNQTSIAQEAAVTDGGFSR